MSVEALISDWRKRINSMAGNAYIAGMDKEDIEQELHITLWQCSESYKGYKGQFSTYFYTCARNRISKMKKHAMAQKRFCNLVPLDDYDIPVDAGYEDIDVIASIDGDKRMNRAQKDAMIEVAMCGAGAIPVSVENANELISDLRYNIGRKRNR